MPFVVGHRLSVGRSQPKHLIPKHSVEEMNVKLKRAVSMNFKEMYNKQIDKAKSGYLPAFIYLTDRVLGRPVESFKIAQVVKLVMGPED